MGGIGFYLRDGKLTLVMNDLGGRSVTVAAADALAPGMQDVALDLMRGQPDASGATPFEVTIRSRGKVVAQEKQSFALPAYFGIPETFDLASDWGSPVLTGYRSGTPFPGKLSDVNFDFNGWGGDGLRIH